MWTILWTIKNTYFLHNSIHPIYQNTQVKCIWPFLKQNLNMVPFGVGGTCKPSPIYLSVHWFNKYLFSTCHVFEIWVKFPKAFTGIYQNFWIYLSNFPSWWENTLGIFLKLYNKYQCWKMAEARFLFNQRRNEN